MPNTQQLMSAGVCARLMLRCGIKRGRIKDDVELKQLQQFWAFATSAKVNPPLGQQEAGMLQQLASIR